MVDRRAHALLLLSLLALVFAGGCEPQVTVEPRFDLGADGSAVGDLQQRVDTLAEEARVQQARADALETEVATLREENVVLATDSGFTFRINTQAAWVLAMAILGLTTFCVARLRYAALGRPAQDDARLP